MKGGWIKLHRSILDHWIWDNPAYLKAWISILMTVNHDNRKVLIKGELIECNRSQSLLSLAGWVRNFGNDWSIQRVRTFFDLLKEQHMINTEGLRKSTRLTVCNYDSYQEQQQTKNTLELFDPTDKEQTENRQITTNKNSKKEKNLNKEEKKSKKAQPDALQLTFSSKEFIELWEKLIKMPKWKNKLPVSLQMSLDKLSKYEEGFSIELIKRAIEGNYQGVVFPDTDTSYSKWKNGSKNGYQHPSTTYIQSTEDDGRF